MYELSTKLYDQFWEFVEKLGIELARGEKENMAF